MARSTDSTPADFETALERLPEGLAPGSTALLVGPTDPSTYALSLRVLGKVANDAGTAFIITTRESADETRQTFEAVRSDAAQLSLGLVDTASQQQYLTAVYDETPVVFTPSPDDLEQLVVALADLDGRATPQPDARHLVVRSLSPILANTSTDQVRATLDRITGLRTGSGLGLFGLDYTAHDEAVVADLADHVDVVYWVKRTAEGRIAFERRTESTRRPHAPSGNVRDD